MTKETYCVWVESANEKSDGWYMIDYEQPWFFDSAAEAERLAEKLRGDFPHCKYSVRPYTCHRCTDDFFIPLDENGNYYVFIGATHSIANYCPLCGERLGHEGNN